MINNNKNDILKGKNNGLSIVKPQKNKKIFISCGEMSGDLHASYIVEKMRKLYIKAHQERLIVSKLRERKELQWKAEGLKQQDAILDDIVNAREYKKSQNLL